MDVGAFCRQSRVVLVVGKGGVGKSTIAATLARAACDAGLDVLLCGLDGGDRLASAFGRDRPFDYERSRISETLDGSGSIEGQTITPEGALVEYLKGHGLGRIVRRLAKAGIVDVVASAIPGIREVLVLSKLRQLEEAGIADLIVVDAPASGHASSFLTSPAGLVESARGGPLNDQARQVVELLHDPARCQVLLVTIPEETPVNEAIESAFSLEDEAGVALGAVVVNATYRLIELPSGDPSLIAQEEGSAIPDAGVSRVLGAARDFRRDRQHAQELQLARLSDELPLAQIRLPMLFDSPDPVEATRRLARALAERITELA